MKAIDIMADHSALENNALSKVIDGLHRTLELNEVLLKCLEAVKIAMNCEASSLMLLDKEKEMLKISMATGPVKDEITGTTFPKDKGIGGWVLANNEAYLTNNVQDSEIFWKDLSESFSSRNIICVPIQDATGNAFGVLQAINRADGRPFEEDDIHTFQRLVKEVSTAIERSRVYEEQVTQLASQKEYISELHHRLKNSLSVISGLIEFDMDDIQDEKARYLLSFTNSRIRTLAKAHSAQSEGDVEDQIGLDAYIEDIIKNVRKSYDDFGRPVTIKTNLQPVKMDLSRSILCGLSVNELLLHSLSRALEGMPIGDITVSLKETDTRMIYIDIEVIGSKDDEVAGVKNGKPNSLFIVKSLISKLNGEIEHSSSQKGSRNVISFQR